ncbi:hypothetical protein I316_07576 [Kwoniella heveanensis BCC8398]|uniref:Uncharacterized protein n=1 Tax=Kwoniella heveanensis BCC8398 TaxID=1296120 RepID=A0A1B9GID6_9TREE|nr:hypothetical protein I316_07576 [Kwoniella heveanensis BCC8398]
MARWKDAPLLHSTNQTWLDSLSNDTDPYSISYGNSAIVSQSTVDVYAILNLLGVLLLSILVLTIAFPRRNRLRRDPCLVNAFVVIIFVNLLNLWYWMASGGSITSYEVSYLPHPRLCRAQAVLQAGSQAAQMSAVLGVVMRLWLKTISLSKPYFSRFRGKYTLICLLAMPYLCLLAFIPPMVIITVDSKQPLLIPTPFYCSLIDIKIRRAYQITTGVIAILTLLLELWTVHLVTYHFRQTTRTSYQAHQSLSASHGIQLETVIRPTRLLRRSFYVRVILFVFWTMGMIMATLYQAFDSTITDPNSDLVFACIGLVAFLCFATQADILKIWRVPTSIAELRALFRFGTSKERLPSETSSSSRTRVRSGSGARYQHRRRAGANANVDDYEEGDLDSDWVRGNFDEEAGAVPTKSQSETLDLQDFLGGPSMKIVNTPVGPGSRRGSRAPPGSLGGLAAPSSAVSGSVAARVVVDDDVVVDQCNEKEKGYEAGEDDLSEEKDLSVYHVDALDDGDREAGLSGTAPRQASSSTGRLMNSDVDGGPREGERGGLVVTFNELELPRLDKDGSLRRPEDMV